MSEFTTQSIMDRSRMLDMHIIHRIVADVNLGVTLYDLETVNLQLANERDRANVVGELALPIITAADTTPQEAHAAILHVRNEQTGGSSFILSGLKKDVDGNATANGHFVRIGASTIIGRNGDYDFQKERQYGLIGAVDLWGEGTMFADTVSREHIVFNDEDGSLGLTQLNKHGTKMAVNLQGKIQGDLEPTHARVYTDEAVARARRQGFLNKLGLFTGRELITRFTTVGEKGEATIDIRAWACGGEAIIVDSTAGTSSSGYDKLYSGFELAIKRAKRSRATNESDEMRILYAINVGVENTMAYDLHYADRISNTLKQRGTGERVVNLAHFLEAGKGVCRHMGLAAAWLATEAYAQGMLDGRGTSEANIWTQGNSGHQWMRYTSRSGIVYIVDPAQKYYGPLIDPRSSDRRWDYYQPSERRLAILEQSHQLK